MGCRYDGDVDFDLGPEVAGCNDKYFATWGLREMEDCRKERERALVNIHDSSRASIRTPK